MNQKTMVVVIVVADNDQLPCGQRLPERGLQTRLKTNDCEGATTRDTVGIDDVTDKLTEIGVEGHR